MWKVFDRGLAIGWGFSTVISKSEEKTIEETAAEIFKIKVSEVTKEQRRAVKQFTFLNRYKAAINWR